MKAIKLVALILPGAFVALFAIGLLALDLPQSAFADDWPDPQCRTVMNDFALKCLPLGPSDDVIYQCRLKSEQAYNECMSKKNSADYEYNPGRPMPHSPPITRPPTESAIPNTAQANLNGKIAKDQKAATADYNKAWSAYNARDYAAAAKLFGQAEGELSTLAADYQQAEDQTNGDAVATLIQRSGDQQKLARCHSAMNSIEDNWPQAPSDQGYGRVEASINTLRANGDCSSDQVSAAWVEARYNEVKKYFADPARNYR